MKRKMIMAMTLLFIAVSGMAQFAVKGTWINNARYTSGIDAGLFRIANRLVITNTSDDIDHLKMLDPYTVLANKVNGTVTFQKEGSVYVNNVQNPYELWQPAPFRYLVEFGTFRMADSTANGRKWGRRVHYMLAFYKDQADSTKLIVAQRNYTSRFTADGKMPSVQSATNLSDLYRMGQLVDSLVFAAAPGTNTGPNVKLQKLPSIAGTQSVMYKPSPRQQAVSNALIKKLQEEDNAPSENSGLNESGNSTLFELVIRSVETLQTDNEQCEPNDYKNKAEYLGTLKAGIWAANNSMRFDAGTFFNQPGTANGSPNPLVLAKGEQKAITANLSKVFGVRRTEFQGATLRISGLLAEIDFPCDKKGSEFIYTAKNLQETSGHTSVPLTKLNSGENHVDVKATVDGKQLALRIHFTIREMN